MTESQNSAEGSRPAASAGTKGPRRAPRRKAAGSPAPRRAVSRPSSRKRGRKRSGSDVERLFRALEKGAGAARARLAAVSETGARATRRTWTRLSTSSRRSIDQLAKQWSELDPKRKKQLLAALAGALAAASAPLIRSRLKKR